MISTINTAENIAIEKFYSQYFLFSYSSLNKLLHSAQSFYNWYILRERKDSLASYLVEGKAIHCLLLEKEMFDKLFVIMPGNIPSSNNKKIVEDMYKIWKIEKNPQLKLKDFGAEIMKWLEDKNLHQALVDDKDLTKSGAKTANQKRLEKVLTSNAHKYFEYFKNSEGKDVISQEAFDRCQEAVNIIKENKTITELLKHGQTGFELLEVHNEKALSCAIKNYPFGLKGIVDNYVIDHTAKTVYINDLKTTGKTLSEFKDTVDYYKYWMQGAIYTRLVKSSHPEVANYKFVMHFIVIDKNNLVYPFPVSNQSLLDWQSQLDEILEIAKYHYVNKDYKLPYEFALGQVTL